MGLQKLKSAGVSKKVIQLKSLTKGKSYYVTKVKKVTTQYGNAIMMELNNKEGVYLPKRVSEVLHGDEKEYEDLLHAVNEGILTMTCDGVNNRDLIFNDDITNKQNGNFRNDDEEETGYDSEEEFFRLTSGLKADKCTRK